MECKIREIFGLLNKKFGKNRKSANPIPGELKFSPSQGHAFSHTYFLTHSTKIELYPIYLHISNK